MATTLSTSRIVHPPRPAGWAPSAAMQRLLAWLRGEASRLRTAQAVADERRRLERDLHDGAQQRLIALRIHLDMAAQRVAQEPAAGPQVLGELAHEAQAALEDLRELVHRSQPVALEREGLVQALSEAAATAPPRVRMQATEIGSHAPEVQAAVYFTCLEALQNALKHAGEQAQVNIRLRERHGRLCFAVHDNGKGFVPSTAAHRRGEGIDSMRERIEACGGKLKISSSPARGTTVSGYVPSTGHSA